MTHTKTIKIADEKSQILYECWRIINQFKLLGFSKRTVFVSVVCAIDDGFNNDVDRDKLVRMWNGRFKCQIFNKRLNGVINKLNNE